MRRARVTMLVILAVVGALLGSSAPVSASVATETGSIDGANFIIQVPSDWNGTLVLYSHGYVVPGDPLVATDAGDPVTGDWLNTRTSTTGRWAAAKRTPMVS